MQLVYDEKNVSCKPVPIIRTVHPLSNEKVGCKSFRLHCRALGLPPCFSLPGLCFATIRQLTTASSFCRSARRPPGSSTVHHLAWRHALVGEEGPNVRSHASCTAWLHDDGRVFDGSSGIEGVRMHGTALGSRYISSMRAKPLDRVQLKLPSRHERFAKKDHSGFEGLQA